MYKTPLVSIIVPCYNQAEYIRETLGSVLSQTYTNWECIIVDDGSIDNTEQIVQEYCKNDSRFKYLKQTNEGPSSARNNGIKASCGKYVLPLDADDIICSTYVEKAVGMLETKSDCKLVYCKARKFGYENGPWKLENYVWENFIITNSIFCSCVFRREDYNKTNGYNPNMKYGYEDWDFLLSLLKPKDAVYCIPEELFFYRIKPPFAKSTNTTVVNHMEFSLKQIVRNHHDIYENRFDEVLYLQKTKDYAEYKLQELLNSPYYKVGLWVLFPYRIWNFFKKKMKR